MKTQGGPKGAGQVDTRTKGQGCWARESAGAPGSCVNVHAQAGVTKAPTLSGPQQVCSLGVLQFTLFGGCVVLGQSALMTMEKLMVL